VALKQPPAYFDWIQSSKCGMALGWPMADLNKWLCICKDAMALARAGARARAREAARAGLGS
jgi:hypothetical protein